MADHQHVLLPLQLHDDGLQPLHKVLVRLGGVCVCVHPKLSWGGDDTPNSCAPIQVGWDGGYLAFGVAVAILVLIPQRELLREALLDLLVGHLLADPRIDLIEGFPLLVGHPQRLGRLDGAFHVAGPDLQLPDALAADELGQSPRVLGAGAGLSADTPPCGRGQGFGHAPPPSHPIDKWGGEGKCGCGLCCSHAFGSTP